VEIVAIRLDSGNISSTGSREERSTNHSKWKACISLGRTRYTTICMPVCKVYRGLQRTTFQNLDPTTEHHPWRIFPTRTA
jgi:hypothetical protein